MTTLRARNRQRPGSRYAPKLVTLYQKVRMIFGATRPHLADEGRLDRDRSAAADESRADEGTEEFDEAE